MFNNLTYKQKFFSLLIITIILSITAYKRSFKLTMSSYNESKQLSEKLEYINSTSKDIGALDSEIEFLNNLIGEDGIVPELVQQEILNFVTNNNDKVAIVSIEQVHNASDNGFVIYSNQLTLEGTFENMLNTVYRFEREFSFSRLVNVSFFKKKDYKTRRQKLYSKIIFQNYEKEIQNK